MFSGAASKREKSKRSHVCHLKKLNKHVYSPYRYFPSSFEWDTALWPELSLSRISKLVLTGFFRFRRFFGSQDGFDDANEVVVGSVGSGGGNGVSRGLRKSLSKLSFLLPQE